jgi:hypothetical protein
MCWVREIKTRCKHLSRPCQSRFHSVVKFQGENAAWPCISPMQRLEYCLYMQEVNLSFVPSASIPRYRGKETRATNAGLKEQSAADAMRGRLDRCRVLVPTSDLADLGNSNCFSGKHFPEPRPSLSAACRGEAAGLSYFPPFQAGASPSSSSPSFSSSAFNFIFLFSLCEIAPKLASPIDGEQFAFSSSTRCLQQHSASERPKHTPEPVPRCVRGKLSYLIFELTCP